MKTVYQDNYKLLISFLKLVSVAISALVIFRWWYHIDKYSVNILFWDQWDLYSAFFDKHDLWEIFSWQHGPHRQGIGFIFTKIVADISGWNSRTEAFMIGAFMCFSMTCAAALKRLLNGRLEWNDAAIPLMFLTLSQYEIILLTLNPSHGAVPLFLFMLYCIVWIVPSYKRRYTGILFLNFFSIYTGFGIFVGIITPLMLGIEFFRIYKTASRKELIFLAVTFFLAALTMASFFVDYKFMPAVDNFQFPVAGYWKKYPIFITLAIANFCGIKVGYVQFFIIVLVGASILLAMIGIAVFHLKFLLARPEKKAENSVKISVSRIIFISIAFTLLFCLNAAIGRVSLGFSAAQASRYITFLIPGFFAIYLHLSSLTHQRRRSLLLFSFLICLIAANFPLRQIDNQSILWFSRAKARWKNHYLQTGNIEKTNRLLKFAIHPNTKGTQLKKKLNYLKTNRLNLYLDSP